MSCAACQARVEKAVSKVAGVTSCSVSLLTNSMGVEGTASSAEIIKAVKAAGYGASIKKDKGSAAQSGAASAEEDLLKDKETPVMVKRLVASAHVYFDGAHDVELEASLFYGWKSYCNGAYAASFNHDDNGYKPEIFHKRFQERCAWST